MDENGDYILELLDILMDALEKQDEIIYRFGRIIKRQATDLALLRNDADCENTGQAQDEAIAEEILEDYKKSKGKLDDYIST